jgi:peroxiredoxin
MKIKEGEKLPTADFFYLDDNNDVQKVDTNSLFKGHTKGVTKIICLSVNDPNVMQAWGEAHDAKGKVLMLGDPFCKFTKSIGAEIDRNEKGLGMRSSRYSMLIEEGVVTRIKEETDPAVCEISAAENFLKEI